MSQLLEVKVPDIGDFKDVPVIEVLVNPGDTIKAEDALITLESDKATMDVPSPATGVVQSVAVRVGDKVSEGTLVLTLAAAGAAPRTSPAALAPAVAQAPQIPPAPPLTRGEPSLAPAETGSPLVKGGLGGISPSSAVAPAPMLRPSPLLPLPERERGTPSAPAGATTRTAHASPSVRRFARELGVDVSKVPGSGPKGRILQQDVQNYVKGVMTEVAPGGVPTAAASAAGGAALGLLPWPKVDFGKFGPTETRPLSRIKKISGANLHRNWVMIPHVTNHEDADITELEAFRVQLNKENEKGGDKAGVKLTMLAFLIKACVAALKKFPGFNASLDGENLVMKQYYHIGFAADTPNGLMVPVIRDADKKGIVEVAKEMGELSKLAREGKLKPDQMQGGCFSISSLGGIGGTYFTPIINAPEVAILGVCRSATRPVWDGKQFVPRLILPLSLSWDHRVIDGAEAARFNTYLAQVLADFRRVML